MLRIVCLLPLLIGAMVGAASSRGREGARAGGRFPTPVVERACSVVAACTPGTTNLAIRNEEIDNVAWTKFGNGVAAPIVTADAALAPDCTTTAERVQFAACPLGASVQSVIYQDTGSAGPTDSLWIQGRTGSGSVSVCNYGPATGKCTAVNFTTEWQQLGQTSGVGTGTYIVVGCQNNTIVYAGASNTGAADVNVWRPQHQSGTTITPAMKTEATPVTCP